MLGVLFPEPKIKPLALRNDDIMGESGRELECTSWNWSKHTSRTSGKEMLKVTYYGGLSDDPIKEYICILHDGYAGQKALRLLGELANQSNAIPPAQNDLDSICAAMNDAEHPTIVEYRKSGKFYEVMKREWHS